VPYAQAYYSRWPVTQLLHRLLSHCGWSWAGPDGQQIRAWISEFFTGIGDSRCIEARLIDEIY
jgi:hypothetical protein